MDVGIRKESPDLETLFIKRFESPDGAMRTADVKQQSLAHIAKVTGFRVTVQEKKFEDWGRWFCTRDTIHNSLRNYSHVPTTPCEKWGHP
jgi:hypothetical protein